MPPAGTHDRSPRILRTGTGSCQAGTRTPIPSEAASGNRGKITRPDVDLCSSQTTIQQSWQLAGLNRKEKPMKFMLISYASKEWEAGLPPDPKLLAAILGFMKECRREALFTALAGWPRAQRVQRSGCREGTWW